MIHIVTGAGPVGSAVAIQLATAGHDVRLLTRSGSGPDHPRIERRKVDVTQPGQLSTAFDGATAVHHCIHGSKYSAKVWQAELPVAEQAVLAAAGKVGAVVVFPESLYSYGPVDGPMTEDRPRVASQGKLGVRTQLLKAREASSTPTVSVAASDFFGPLVRNAHAGERMVPRVLAGKKVQVVGSLDLPHSFTYVPDLAAAMIKAAADPQLWNSFLHAPTGPAVTTRQLVQAIAEAGGVPVPKMAGMPGWLVKTLGVIPGLMHELAETSYMFTRPFVLDSSASQARLGLEPTALDVALATTVAWWRAQKS